MEIEFVHRRPRGPMRVRNLLGALKEIPPPDLSLYLAQSAEVMFKQRERDKKLQGPKRWFLNFRLDPRRQGGANSDGFPDTGRHSGEVLESAWGSLRIHNVRAKESATAIEFEVEIASIRLGLSEE